MTREKIIKRLRTMKFAWALTADATPEAQETVAWATEAINGAIKALKGPTREQVEKMRGEWIPFGGKYIRRKKCSRCGWDGQEHIKFYSWCPACGAPMTDEAVDLLANRLEEVLKDAD